jgi:integrase
MGVQVREKPPGSGVWWVFINHNGRRRSKRVGKQETAEEVAEKMRAKITLGDFSMLKKKPEVMTFKDYAERWLSLPHDQKESTLDVYKDHLRLHIYPKFGNWQIQDITRKDLKAFFEDLLSKGKALSTVKIIKSPISMILQHALDSEVIESNPLNDLNVKGKNKALNIEPLTEEEASLLLEQAKTYLGGFYYPHILCALRTGIRLGELQALEWGNIDFNGRFIEVKRTHRKQRVTDTKNRKSRRVDMSPLLADTLKALKVNQGKRALKAGRSMPEWVFADRDGNIFNEHFFRKALEACLSQAKLRRIRIHDLRHTYATIRLLRGHNPGDVSNQMGHSSIKITYDTYGHWIPGKFKREVDELDMLHPGAPQAHPETSSQKEKPTISSR